jgi:hypothetical protein
MPCGWQPQATAVSQAAAIPSPASAIMPGSAPASRRTACMPPTVAPSRPGFRLADGLALAAAELLREHYLTPCSPSA